MKKVFAFVLVAMMSMSAMAQHEIGAIVGGFNGISYKYWAMDNLAIQADLGVGLTEAYMSTFGQGFANGIYDFTLNPNVLYHIDLAADVKLYVGGGFNLGFMATDLAITNFDRMLGKFGANAVVGACYQLPGVPLALAVDFRPGYGMGFRDADPTGGSGLLHMFDWKLALAVRYCL